jgi:hypothetical protein
MSDAGTAEFNANIYAGGGYIGLNTGDRIHFTDNTSAIIEVNGGERLTVAASGDVDVETGDLFFSTAGKGIVLGATSNVAANTLDDYEEGTWTPAFNIETNANFSTDSAYGHYTKVGRQVTVHGVIQIDKTGGTNNVFISGLPFNCQNSSINFIGHWYAGKYDGGGNRDQHALAAANSSYIYHYDTDTTDGSSNYDGNTGTRFANSTNMDNKFSVTYFTD